MFIGNKKEDHIGNKCVPIMLYVLSSVLYVQILYIYQIKSINQSINFYVDGLVWQTQAMLLMHRGHHN